MLRYFTIFGGPLLLLISFFAFFYRGTYWPWFLSAGAIVIIVSVKILAGGQFWQNKTLLVNLVFVYLSQFLFLLQVTSDSGRELAAFVWYFLWCFVFWLASRHFLAAPVLGSADYLPALKFFYYLNFWFLSVGLYALIALIHFPVIWAGLTLATVTALWSRHILKIDENKDRHYLFLVVWLMVQMFFIAYLPAIDFYTAGTVLTLGLFFLLDRAVQQPHRWRLGGILFLASIFVLLITSLL